MMWGRVNRDNPERCYIIVRNGYSTASLTNGQPVMWDLSATTYLGIDVTIPKASASHSFAGVIAETIAASDYGLMQVYGYHSATIVQSKATTASIIKTGTALVMATAAFTLRCVSNTAIDHEYPCAFAMEAYSLTATAAKKVFIKAL